jgi:NADH-quinone oxidoreductase subunit F
MLPMQGAEADGVTNAMNFLKTYHLTGSVNVGKHVVVVGGGNAAIDAARTALRLGGGDVTILYRRTRKEMPAYEEEIHAALEEGIQLEILAAPVEIIAENGCMTAVKSTRMELGKFDRSGRRSPHPTGETFVIEADQLIFAVGQTLNCDTLFGDIHLETHKGTRIQADPLTGETSEPWIFAGGDAVSGPSTVIEAIAGGERAAVGIDSYLTGPKNIFWRNEKRLDTDFDPEADPIPDHRHEFLRLPVESRKHSFTQVEQNWNEDAAMTECQRCLRCDFGK